MHSPAALPMQVVHDLGHVAQIMLTIEFSFSITLAKVVKGN